MFFFFLGGKGPGRSITDGACRALVDASNAEDTTGRFNRGGGATIFFSRMLSETSRKWPYHAVSECLFISLQVPTWCNNIYILFLQCRTCLPVDTIL